jgi:hypothetical protein
MSPKIALIISLILFLFLTIILIKIPSKIVINSENYTHTKALCNDSNYCEDYVIECSKNKATKITPTGFSIQQSKDWKDPRNNRKELCN